MQDTERVKHDERDQIARLGKAQGEQGPERIST